MLKETVIITLFLVITSHAVYFPNYNLRVQIGDLNDAVDAPAWVALIPANISDITETESYVCWLELTRTEMMVANLAQSCFKQVNQIKENIITIANEICDNTLKTHRQVCYPSGTQIKLETQIGQDKWQACINDQTNKQCDGRMRRQVSQEKPAETQTVEIDYIMVGLMCCVTILILIGIGLSCHALLKKKRENTKPKTLNQQKDLEKH